MILRIKLRHDQVYNLYEPTGMFHVNRFIEYGGIKDVLLLANQFIATNNVTGYLKRNNEIQFNVTRRDGVFQIVPIKDTSFSFYKIEEAVCVAANKTRSELFLRSKQGDLCAARAVVFAAGMYFGGIGYSKIAKKYGYNHASIMHSRQRTLPSLLLSKDVYTKRIVNAVADLYQDDGFIGFCSEFGCSRIKVPKSGTSCQKRRQANVWGYRGVLAKHDMKKWACQIQHDKKRIYLGSFISPHDAARAYNNYIIENNLIRELNMVKQ